MAETPSQRRARMAETRQLLEPFLQSVPLSSLYELNRDPLNRYAKILAPNRVKELEKYPSLMPGAQETLPLQQWVTDILRAQAENPDLVSTIVDLMSLSQYDQLIAMAVDQNNVYLLDALLQDASPQTWYQVLQTAFGKINFNLTGGEPDSNSIIGYLVGSGRVPLNLFVLDNAEVGAPGPWIPLYLFSHGAIVTALYNNIITERFPPSFSILLRAAPSGFPIDQQLVAALHEKFPDVPVEEIEFSVNAMLADNINPLDIYRYTVFE